jgi:hypothetical protein
MAGGSLEHAYRAEAYLVPNARRTLPALPCVTAHPEPTNTIQGGLAASAALEAYEYAIAALQDQGYLEVALVP